MVAHRRGEEDDGQDEDDALDELERLFEAARVQAEPEPIPFEAGIDSDPNEEDVGPEFGDMLPNEPIPPVEPEMAVMEDPLNVLDFQGFNEACETAFNQAHFDYVDAVNVSLSGIIRPLGGAQDAGQKDVPPLQY